jgi:hypothetical protein
VSPAAGGYASGVIGAGASWLGQLRGLDLKARVDQSLDNDFSLGLRIRDRHRKVVAVEQNGSASTCSGVSSLMLTASRRAKRRNSPP